MRREYVKPVMQSEEFVANEYVAACWKMKCNVPYGFGYYEKNGVTGYQEGQDQYIAGGAKGCNEDYVAHGITTSEPTANAWWQATTKPQGGGHKGKGPHGGGHSGSVTNVGEPISVFYFYEDSKGHQSHHFSLLSSVEYEESPNASN